MITPKDILMNLIQTAQDDELFQENAIELTNRFFYNRFLSVLKQYNGDEAKAYDAFIVKKNLYLFNLYIEEFIDLQRSTYQSMYPSQWTENPYNMVLRKELRQIHHYLCADPRILDMPSYHG